MDLILSLNKYQIQYTGVMAICIDNWGNKTFSKSNKKFDLLIHC
jgi:hypothetical protein